MHEVQAAPRVTPKSVAERKAAARDLTLPSPPLGMALVLEAAENPETSLARLGWLVNREPSLTSHILKLSNSAAYGVGRPVGSVGQATVYLGARTVRNMTLSHIVQTLTKEIDVGAFDTTAFWEHALRRAGAAHVVATRCGFDDPGEAFTAGLMQELGLLVMVVERPELSEEIAAAMALPFHARAKAESDLLGTTHDQTFAAIASEWGIPGEITTAIGAHHEVEHEVQVSDRRGRRLAEILRLADAVADITQVGANRDVLARVRGYLDRMPNGKRVSLETVTDETARAMREMSSALEIRIRPQPSFEELKAAAHRALASVSSSYEGDVQRLEAQLAEHERERRALEKRNGELERLASTDALTGVANRRALCDALESALGRTKRGEMPMTVLLLDLDHFKQVNDVHGHDAGDVVLKEVASRLRGALRAGDLVGRLGGEEFAVVLAGVPARNARFIAERLRVLVSVRPIALGDGGVLRVTASIGGFSVEPGHGVSLEDALKTCDLALYASKNAGRNRVSWPAGDL
ncbi:MAG: GGDEF domain-containing protein [Deltaproteobacteria bacterium]|nr:GGDEF domain-containing protein [Deltaproteobacteria bacterium]